MSDERQAQVYLRFALQVTEDLKKIAPHASGLRFGSGLRLGDDFDDRSTWTVEWGDDATEEEKIAAQDWVHTWQPDWQSLLSFNQAAEPMPIFNSTGEGFIRA